MKDEKNLRFVKGHDGKPNYYVTEITLNYLRVRRFAGYIKDAARIYLAELRLAAKEGRLDELLKPARSSAVIFSEYAKALLGSPDWKKKSSLERDEISLSHLARELKGMRLDEITPAVARRYMAQRKADGMADATINLELTFLKSVLYRAEEEGAITKNLIAGRKVKKIKLDNGREEAILELGLTDDDLRRLVDCAADYLKPILRLALTAGPRLGEILRAEWTHFNPTLRTLRVPSKNAKSKKARTLPIDPELAAEIDSMPRTCQYIFVNPETGTKRRGIKEAFQAACKAAGIPYGRHKGGVVFHDLRHFALYRLCKVTDIVTASKIAGHASLDMTRRYIHSTSRDMADAVDAVAARLFPVAGRQKDVNAQNGEGQAAAVAAPQFLVKSVS
jgi:integrase